MAEMEHFSWNAEKWLDGWQFGCTRDDSKKLHNCLVERAQLTREDQDKDSAQVDAIPGILKHAGYGIYRQDGVTKTSKGVQP